MVVDADTDEGVQWCKDNLSVGIYSITAKGAHFFFKQPKNQKVNCEIKNTKCGIDIKADGGLVVTPPSVHGSGKFYRWSSDETPMFDDIPEMSLAEYEVLQELLNPTQKYTTPHRNVYQNSVKNHKSASTQDFYSPADVGERNDALTRQTGSLLGRGFSVNQIHQQTIDWNRNNPSPLSEEERFRTVESMISTDDRRNPLKHLTDTSGDEYPAKTLKVLYEYSQRGERGCAELLLKRFKDETLYNHDSKEWLKYDSGVWVKDSISNITWRSQKFLLEVFFLSCSTS